MSRTRTGGSGTTRTARSSSRKGAELADGAELARLEAAPRRTQLDADLAEARWVRDQTSVPVQPRPYPRLPKRERPKPGLKILVVGDAHAKPDTSNARFDWLGRLIVDRQPDAVVSIGDWTDFPSLGDYDRGKRCFEGRRYWKDLHASWDARARVMAQLDSYNAGSRRPYRPKFYETLGNHEHRAWRVIDLEPRFEGTIDPHGDLRLKEFGWQLVPFLDVIELGGVAFSHYFPKNGRAPAYTTKHLAANTLAHTHRSSVFGHAHRLDYFEEPRGEGRIQCVNAGCYFEHWEEWAGQQNRSWSRGLLELTDVREGQFGYQWLPMREIRSLYG